MLIKNPEPPYGKASMRALMLLPLALCLVQDAKADDDFDALVQTVEKLKEKPSRRASQEYKSVSKELNELRRSIGSHLEGYDSKKGIVNYPPRSYETVYSEIHIEFRDDGTILEAYPVKAGERTARERQCDTKFLRAIFKAEPVSIPKEKFEVLKTIVLVNQC